MFLTRSQSDSPKTGPEGEGGGLGYGPWSQNRHWTDKTDKVVKYRDNKLQTVARLTSCAGSRHNIPRPPAS